MSATPTKCPVCGAAATRQDEDAVPKVVCERCGEFWISARTWGTLTPDQIAVFAGYIRSQNDLQITPYLTTDLVGRLLARTRPRIKERAHRLLTEIANVHPQLDDWVDFDFEGLVDARLLGISYSKDAAELRILAKYLWSEGLLHEDPQARGSYAITPAGHILAESLGDDNRGSAKAFVAMNFDSSMNEAWTAGFEPAIHAAGYKAIRISEKDYVGGISDEIMAEIRSARFVVADYTGQKAGVYFEAGFALGLGLKVIPTCREDEVGKLHFDIKHLNTLLWTEPADLVDRLSKRIRAVIGAGPNPV